MTGKFHAVPDVSPAGSFTFRPDGLWVDFSFDSATINGVECPATNVSIMVPHLWPIHQLLERLRADHARATAADTPSNTGT